MKQKIYRLFAFMIVLALVVTPVSANQISDNVEVLADPEIMSRFSANSVPVSETGLYVVQLADPSLARYTGDIAGLAATSPTVTGVRKLDVSAPASVAYLSYLEGKQSDFIAQMNASLGRSVEVPFQYFNALNALAVAVSHEEAIALAELPGVAAVYADTIRELETDVGPTLIGGPTFWEGEYGFGEHRGEGVIVGMLDTGVNPVHPSFAAVDGDGFEHENPYGAGNYVGVCDPGAPDYDPTFPCNHKLIGAWNFHPDAPSAWDWNNHGSHVGSTIAGNIHEAEFTVGPDTFNRTISGVSPRSNVISYLVCYPSCPSASSVAAVDQAIADGVDVLNYSISGGDSPWTDPVDLAFLDGYAAGIFISASAGNAGPGPGTVAKTGPWNASVAASTHNRIIANTVDVVDPAPPPELVGMGAIPGTGPEITGDIVADIIWAGDVDPANVRGCNPFPGGAFTSAIALIQRGDCTFEIKVNNATAAGAIAAIIYNQFGGPPIVMGGLESTTIEAVFIDQGDGDALAAFISASPDPVEARINEATSVIVNDAWQDIMAGFSSKGPSQWDLLKPDYTAPGVNILAAGWDGPDAYVFLQGTSMSSPHGAGAAALMVDRYPTWSPAEVKSALAMTAWQDMLKEDGVTPTDYFDMGTGRIDLTQGALIGLVMHETAENYEDANPFEGGEPKTLNQPSMVDHECVEQCSWTRTVRSVLDVPVTYNVLTEAPVGMTITVTPDTFTIAAGATQELDIQVEVDLDVLPAGAWAFAQVHLEEDATSALRNPGDISSLTGSHVAFDPTVGGDEYYIPGTTQTFCFEAVSHSPDWEYAYSVWQNFPSDWVVTDAYLEGTPSCTSGGSFGTFSWSFHTAPYEVKVNHSRYHGSGGDTCYAHYCFEVTSAPAGDPAPVSWYWDGDGWGSPPYHPCSDDGYTPSGEPACDEMINPVASVPGALIDPILLEEGFEDLAFPPDGWSVYDLDGATPEWIRTTTYKHSGEASAVHSYSMSVEQDGWLVTPALDIMPGTYLSFYDMGAFMSWYVYSGVWLSTGSCDPNDGEFVELLEVDDSIGYTWRQVGPLDLSAYAGETACIAFVYGGYDAHAWYIDDVLVEILQVSEDVATHKLPIAIKPFASAPAMTLDPEEIYSSQDPNQVVTKTLAIGNEGGVDLEWEVVTEAPLTLPSQLPLGPTTPIVTGGQRLVTIGDNVLAHSQALPAGEMAAFELPSDALNTITITHSLSQNIMAGNSVACSPDGGVTTTENGYLRTFVLSDFGIFGDFDIIEVSFGLENLSGVGQTLDVNLFTLDTEPFIYANMTLIETEEIYLDPQSLTIITLPIEATIPAGSTLVVEVDWPDTSGVSGFFVGSNNLGQTAPSYLRSASCGLPEPTNVANIGFPGMHIVMNVTGLAEAPTCDAPHDVDWVDVDPLSGTVAPNASQNVSVIFDSTDMAAGEYTANLCLASNDPDRSFDIVPLTLDILATPSIQVSPESLESAQEPDTQVTLPLDIINTGLADLIWLIEQTPGFGEGPAVIYEAAPSIPAEVFTGTVPEGYQPQGLGEVSSPAGPWQTLASAPFVSMDNVYIGYDGKGYQIGGYGSNGQVGIYDANAGTWTTGATAPSPYIEYPVDGCFGFNADGDPVGVLFNDATSGVTTLHRYNIATDSWDTPPVPSGFPANGLWAPAIASVHPYTGENVCYISGGATAPGGGNTSALYAYYPDTNTVENLGNFNYIAQGFAFHATWYAPWIGAEGGICVGGGVNAGSVVTADTQCYDIGAGIFNATNADLGAMPTGLWGMATGILFEDGDYQLWVAQGADAAFALWPNSAYYSYTNDQWYIGPTPPRTGYRVDGTNIPSDDGYSFYVVGGSSGGFTPTNGHERNFSPDFPFPPPEPAKVLYDNGPFITSYGDGPGGANVSLLQNITLGMTTLGAAVYYSDPGPHFRMADEFTVTTPGGWSIDNVVFYAYQTGSPTDSTFTGVTYQIWDGPPDDPASSVIYGDMTTNRFEDTDWTNVYRYSEGTPGTTRPIMWILGEADVHLEPGTYWIDWQLDGSLASGPWQPPITIIGETTTGNSMQLVSTGWTPFVDSGTTTPQGVPFQLWGLTVCDVPGDVDWLSLSAESGVTAPGEVDEVLVTLDSTGLEYGEYSAYLCVYSNDPNNPEIVIPVEMTVTEFAHLQVAHLAPFAEDASVTITLNGVPALTDFAYGDSTEYIELPAGEYDVAVIPTGAMDPAIEATVILEGDTYYTVVAVGDGVNQDLGLMLLEDDLTEPEADKFHLRLGHLAPFAAGPATADIRLQDGTPVLLDVDFGDVTGFIPLDAGTYNLIITTPGGAVTLIDPLPVDFAEGMIISAFATGEGVNQDLGVFALPAGVEGFFLPLSDYGVQLIAEEEALSGEPAEVVEYTLTITNTGNATDTFEITFEGNDWDVHLPEDSFTLAAGVSTDFVVHVTIPDNVADGDLDAVIVTATSTYGQDVSASVTLTTTAEVPEPDVFYLFAPAVFKDAEVMELFSLTILHTNDFHARVDEYNRNGARCTEADADAGLCIGGAPRVATVVDDFRAKTGNLLVLDAGDQFQGTLFFTLFQGDVLNTTMNYIGYDAMAVGNHEFDSGPAVLADFIDDSDFPLLGANIDASEDPDLAGKILPYVILERGGHEIGIIGLITPDSENISSPGEFISFDDPLTSLQATADELTALGVNKIIALTHLGYGYDLELAQNVSGVDIIIGGHSHTFTYTPTDPIKFGPPEFPQWDPLAPAGEYPTLVESPAGEPVLVITAYQWGSFLGNLYVNFCPEGMIYYSTGNPIFLGTDIAKDPVLDAMLDPYREAVQELIETPVGETTVDLPISVAGQRICRLGECLLGNLVADAMLWMANEMDPGAGYQIAFQNGGGLRAPIMTGVITMGDVLETLPFGNTIATFELQGIYVKEALENGAHRFPSENGGFAQVAGINYTIDPSQPAGERIVYIEVWTGTEWEELDPDAMYKVVTNDFMRRGGDNYTVFRDYAVDPYDFGPLLDEALADYLGVFSPVTPEIEGRIIILP